MTRRPKTPQDQAALDRARAHLRSIGSPRTTAAGNLAELTDEERAERLRRRAAQRTIATRSGGGDAA